MHANRFSYYKRYFDRYDDEWISGIKKIYDMTSAERKNLAEKNLRHVKTYYSDEALDADWLKIFEKLETVS